MRTLMYFLHDKSVTESQLKMLKVALTILTAMALGAQGWHSVDERFVLLGMCWSMCLLQVVWA